MQIPSDRLDALEHPITSTMHAVAIALDQFEAAFEQRFQDPDQVERTAWMLSQARHHAAYAYAVFHGRA